METEEKTKTLTGTVESAVIEGERSVKGELNMGGDVGVMENTVVESEMSVGKTFFCSNGSGGGFISNSKKTGSPAVEGLTDGDSTIVVEFDNSIGSLNEKGGNLYHEKGSLAGIEGNPGEESIMIPGSEHNENFEATNKGGESHGEGKEDEGDQEREYSVGDFVWGKIWSRPWWPGRIYDPSDASDYARKYNRGEKLLVVYFGDESFSWCSTSQLKPFAEDFEEMSGQSNSSSFENAVRNAIKEMGKLGELKMTCYCISDDNRIGLDRYATRNAGIKKGVLVPDCDLNKLLIRLNEPTYLLSMLRYVAEVVSITSLLEFTVLKSWLSAFYRAKVGHGLPVCYESVFIEGLEDKSMIAGVTDVDDFSGVLEFPFGRPVEEDGVSWPAHPELGQANQSLLQKCPEIADDKLYERRKKKSIAELIKDVVVKPNNTKGSLVKDVLTGKLMETSDKGKGKSNDEAVSRYGNDLFSPSGKKGRGKRSETEGPVKSQEDEDEVQRERNGGGEREDETRNNDSVSSVGYNNTDAKEKTEKGLALGRKRGGWNLVETPESSKKNGPGEKNGGGHGEEVTKCNDGVCRVGNEHTNAKAENEKNLASLKKGARRKRVNTQKSGEKKVPREKNGDGSGGEGTEKVSVSNIEKDKNVKDEKGWTSGKKKGRSKRLETQESVEKKVPGEKKGGGDDEEGTKKKDDVSNIGNEDANAKEETEKGLASARKRGKGKKEEARGSEKSAEKEVHSVRSGGWEGEEKTEGDNVLSVEIDDGNTKEETDKGLASRERKKSKYLSHPFTSLKRRGVGNLNSEKDYLEAESEKIAKVARIGERMISAAGQLITSSPVVNFSEEPKVRKGFLWRQERVPRIGRRVISAAGQLIRSPPVVNFSEETKVGTSAISTPSPPSEDQKKIMDSVEISASTKEVLTEVKSAALNHQHLKDKSTLEMFINFISAFRSSLYLNGSKYKIYHRRRLGRKRELPSSGPVTEIPESKSPRKRNEKKKQEISRLQKFSKDGGELRKVKRKKNKKEIIDKKECGDASLTPVSLIVTFPSGFSLPSKNDLKALFSKFGALDDTETEIHYNSSCATVVFVKSSDAEEAFNASVKESPFGPAKVSYGLGYSSDGYQNASFPPPSNHGSKIPVDSASQVLFIVKEKLGLMTSMLTKSDGNMLPEVQSKLEVEVKGLLEKVNTVVDNSTTAHVQ